MFRFKQFVISDDQSTMKVGTDAVLLGSWAWVPEGAHQILEVGCGCGVISMMVAQRAQNSDILGIDIHEPSVKQAQKNLQQSPFRNVRFSKADFLSFPKFSDSIGKFTTIISNPPYHTESLLPPDKSRAMARNEQFLPFSEFVHTSSLLLEKNGHLQVILPVSAKDYFETCCKRESLFLKRTLLVRSTDSKPVRRVLLDFIKLPGQDQKDSPLLDNPELSEIILMDSSGLRSKAYSALCKDYYL